MARPRKFSDIDFEKLRFSGMKPMGVGGHALTISSTDGSPVVFQTPKLVTPFGLSTFGDAGSPAKYSLDLSLCEHDEFYAFYASLDSFVLAVAESKSAQWFKRSLPSQAIAEMYCSNIKLHPADARLRLTVPFRGGTCQVPVFSSSSRELILHTDITRGSTVIALVELTGMWFVNRRFGLRWKLSQVMLCTAGPAAAPAVTGYAFVDDDDDAS